MRALLVESAASRELYIVEFLSVRDVPCPRVEEGQARVRVKAAGIGFVEALKIAGRYQTKDPLPFVPGTEFASVVEEVGHGVAWPKIGERVFGIAQRGALAEEICVGAEGLLRIPDRLSLPRRLTIRPRCMD
jgi:NADPH2:quinone reductase